MPELKHDAKTKLQLQETIDLVDEAIAQTRSLSHELSPASLQLHGLFNALNNLAEDMYEKHGLKVHLDLESEAEPQENGVVSILYLALKELMFNVVKHSDRNEAWLKVRRVADEIFFSIEDEGKGMTSEELHDKRETGGVLGLFGIEQRLIYLGGRMEIESFRGGGTQVTLALPAGKMKGLQSLEEDAPKETSEKAPPPEQSEVTQKSIDVVRLLLADDHKVMRESLAVRLGNEADFYVIAQTSTGLETVQATEEFNPDVVVMDVRMPDMNGIEAAAKIKRLLPHVHIVGLSMHSDPDTASRMKEAGAEAFLSKSGSPEQLCETIRKIAGVKTH